MITVEEASQIIQTFMPKWGPASAPLTGLSDSFIGDNLFSDRPYPPFNRVMMDGIAVSFTAFQEGRREFKVLGVAAAGDPAQILTDTSGCIEVMTGVPLPLNTDLVIPYEHLNINDHFATVNQEMERLKMENVHLKGSDCGRGDKVLSLGSKMNGPHWGIAASMGYTSIQVERKPRIMVISTGDELVEVGEIPLDHQIRRSNVYALKASLLFNGYQDVELAHLNDDPLVVAEHYKKFSPQFDMLIYSGGVSKGKFDYLPNVWIEMGVTKHFHQVAQRPGKPLWFGVDEKLKTAVFGLPGNPVSSLVCLHRYVIPTKKIYAKLTSEIIFKKDLTCFLPVSLRFDPDGSIYATPFNIKNSGEFTALAGSDGLIELPKNQSQFKVSESYAVYLWKGL